MVAQWNTWSPYRGLVIKEFGRIWLSLLVGAGFSILVASLLSNRQSKVVEYFGNTQGTYMELLRVIMPFVCLMVCTGFAMKLIREDIDSQSWRFHQQLPLPLVVIYLVKFIIGLFATVLCICFLQITFLFISKDEILITWKHFAYPAVRLWAVAACMWSVILLATSLGSFRWFAYAGLIFFYIKIGERVPPLNLISYEGSLEEVNEFAPTGPLIVSALITVIGLLMGSGLAHYQRTAFVGFFYQRIPPIVKVSSVTGLLIVLVVGAFGLAQLEDDTIAEKELTAFGQTVDLEANGLRVEAWMPKETDQALKDALRGAFQELPLTVANFRNYVQLRSEVPKCVVILRPDLGDPKDWQVDFYRNSQTVVIRMFPEQEHYDSLSEVLAKFYLYAVLEEGLLYMPIATEAFGWLARGLPSYLSPIDLELFFTEEDSSDAALDWLRENEVSDWPVTRDGFYDTDGAFNHEPRLSINERELASYGILKVLRERHGAQWVQALCRETLVLDTTLPDTYEELPKMLMETWDDLLGFAVRAKIRPARKVLRNKGGTEQGLTAKAAILLEERLSK